ncbi:hypothetical protein H2198_000768 [Neophaeococcomyces mojaviensis]|uniref:Uncharacterized protein n=1 Tax=Neophaeococcomyces mojaviensis TaxID=3383035 RepID=A0ACC3AIU4_9EURO|nr:hypothetical protein H2198_000768 [Knufia sp. JES_112]
MKLTAEQAKHANYACAALALVILLIRIAVSRRRQKPLDASFFLVILSTIVIIARLIVNYYYLRYGTASDALGNAHYFNTHDYHLIKQGSILSLVARVLITASCWLQICLLLLFYSQMMYGIRWVSRLIKICWVTTASTFVAVVLATFLECHPFHLYWQTTPDPGTCIRAYVQLLLQCVSNISIDLMLLAISYPILFCKGRSWKQHVRVGTLFILGTFCIIVTIVRLISIYGTNSAQPTRSLWASVQMIVSTFVANAPTIYGDLHVAQRKKCEPIIRRMSRPELWPSNVSSDIESSIQHFLTFPERAATGSSSRSSRKEWFDQIENVP